MKYISILALLIFTGCNDIVSQIGDDSQSDSGDQDIQVTYLELINSIRETDQVCGDKLYKATHKLVWNDSLYKASLEHSRDMAINSFLSHYGSYSGDDITAHAMNLNSGSDMTDRVVYNGYTDYIRVTENIAAGESLDSPQKVLDLWLRATEHCVNIMDPHVDDVGMATFKSRDQYKNYWTVDFGAR